MKIQIKRSNHINLGKNTFSSIDVDVLMEKEVSVEKYDEEYKALSEVMDATMALEVKKTIEEAETLYGNNLSPNVLKYKNLIEGCQDVVEKQIVENIKVLGD